ncbi:hypothetical protein C7476_101294 [Phyllobacterium bourgognense]|uniref:Uncharacterized protein n=1 Tax=Phyllobacterium bourgognense TaxID=314236 RepID=A0A368Z6W8_9HYPH|nr:hypothetical protein C7476_101294 [Phyllobacterium bourgognense]
MILIAPDMLLSVDPASVRRSTSREGFPTISRHRHTDPRLDNLFMLDSPEGTRRSCVFHRRTPIAEGEADGLAHASGCDLATRSYKL